MKPKPISSRHKWGERVPFQFKTERTCTRCDITRVTRHDDPNGRPWIEWFRDAEQIISDATPPCDGRLERELAGSLEVTA